MDTKQLDSQLESFFGKLKKTPPAKPSQKAVGAAKKKPKSYIKAIGDGIDIKLPAEVVVKKPPPKMFHELDTYDRETIRVYFAIAQTNWIPYDDVIPRVMEKFNVAIEGMSVIWDGVHIHIEEYSWTPETYDQFALMMLPELSAEEKMKEAAIQLLKQDGVTHLPLDQGAKDFVKKKLHPYENEIKAGIKEKWGKGFGITEAATWVQDNFVKTLNKGAIADWLIDHLPDWLKEEPATSEPAGKSTVQKALKAMDDVIKQTQQGLDKKAAIKGVLNEPDAWGEPDAWVQHEPGKPGISASKEQLIAFIQSFLPDTSDDTILAGITSKYGFYISDSLKELVKEHKKRLCPICGEVLFGQQALDKHLETVHGHESVLSAALKAGEILAKPDQYAEFKKKFGEIFMLFCQSMKDKGIALPDNLHLDKSDEGAWNIDVFTGPKGTAKAVPLPPSKKIDTLLHEMNALAQASKLQTGAIKMILDKLSVVHFAKAEVMTKPLVQQAFQALAKAEAQAEAELKVDVDAALKEVKAQTEAKLVKALPPPAKPLEIVGTPTLPYIHDKLGGQGDPNKLTLKGHGVNYYTIEGKAHHYKFSKGILMAMKESWKGDPDVRLCLWALVQKVLAKKVTVHYGEDSFISLALMAELIAADAGYKTQPPSFKNVTTGI